MSQSVKDEELKATVEDHVDPGNPAQEEYQELGGQADTLPAPSEQTNSTERALFTNRDVEAKSVTGDKERNAEPDPDPDSEAETLIQSPEKKKSMASETTNVIYPVTAAVPSDTTFVATDNVSDQENIDEKQKRSQERSAHDAPKRSSRHSSPLSSPVLQNLAAIDSELGDHQDDGSTSDPGSSEAEDKNENAPDDPSQAFDKMLKHKKRRRPSDLATSSSTHKRTKRTSLDALDKRKTRSATYPENSGESSSPEPTIRREHRRGASTQIPIDGERRRRGRPPNILTRRNVSVSRDSNSDDDSEQGKRPRTNLQKLMSTDHDAMSPAKVGPRKWKDKNGRTYLARACAAQDLELAKQKFEERPGDLNMADNAGNTPLQIAALEGYADIVGFLLSKGADVNVRNLDKDTPLIDSVENGHVEVIRLLLAHGANPRMGNAKGDEPFELVPKDDENFDIIRKMLADAKERGTKRPSQDEQELVRDGASSRAPSATSPRESPPIGPRSPPAVNSRRRTGRSESTRNDLLWAQNTPESLVKLSAKGDVQGVAGALEVIGKASTEAVIAAAKAGHYEALNMLIAIGNPVTDPQPVPKFPPGYSTPLLAAIGRGHPDVVKLLVTQSGFNPTKRFRERTYFELAEDRKGSKWEEEYNILKEAYDKYSIARGRKPSSPHGARDVERARPSVRRSPSVTSPTGTAPSPELSYKGKLKPEQDKTVEDPDTKQQDDEDKRGEFKAKHRTRRSQGDLPPMLGIDGDTSVQKRRRLMTGKEHRNRHTVNTSSDNEGVEMDTVEVKQEEDTLPALKRTREMQSPETKNGAKDMRKKRRTIPDSSPEPRSRPVDDGLADEVLRQAGQRDPPKVPLSDASKRDSQSSTNRTVAEPLVETIQQLQQDSAVNVDPTDFIGDLTESVPPSKPLTLDLLPPPRSKASPEMETAVEDTQEQADKERARQEAIRRQEEVAREEQRRKDQEAAVQAEAEAEAARQREASRRLAQIEAEQAAERERVEALPVVLARTARMINNGDGRVKSPEWMRHFIPLYTAQTQQLDPACDASEKTHMWMPNFQAACLLCTKDLSLLDFPSFDRRMATEHERKCLWRVARNKLSYDFNASFTSIERMTQLDRIGQQKFMAMSDLFWIRLSDFMGQVPRFSHLSNLHLHTQPISLKSYSSLNLDRRREDSLAHKPVLLNGIGSPSARALLSVNGADGTNGSS